MRRHALRRVEQEEFEVVRADVRIEAGRRQHAGLHFRQVPRPARADVEHDHAALLADCQRLELIRVPVEQN